jgi:hypothetical protein
MSIAGINSNFSAATTTEVQTEANQYLEDEQVLTQTLQTSSLTNPGGLLNSLQTSNLNTALTALNAIETPSAAAGATFAAVNETASAANPNQQTGFGIEAANNTNNTNNTNQNSANNNPQNTTQQPGALQTLAETIQAEAQQAYTASQQGYPKQTGATNPLGTVIG